MKEGHPSSHSQLLEGIYNFYDKKVNPTVRTNSTRACYDCLALTKLTGADPGFFSGGGALISFNKPHSFFRRIPVVLENSRSSQGGGVRTPCTLPLDPSLADLAVYMERSWPS